MIMKIYHDPASNLNLTKYGIQIPLTDDRDSKIYHFLLSKKIPVEVLDTSHLNLSRSDLARVHSNQFLDKLFGPREKIEECIIEAFELINERGEFHRYDPTTAKAPLRELLDSVLLKTKGTMLAVKAALEGEDSFFLGGGFHHAMSFGGRGFCLINDIVIAARWAQQNLGAKLIWIIDVDAHKGDGTAEITQNDESIKTLSIHMAKGWPLDSGTSDSPWFIPSDIEIPITQEQSTQYLSKLEEGLHLLPGQPDLAIIVQGSDPYEHDKLPSASLLKLSQEDMLKRDLLVWNFLKSRQIPQAYVMAGGYGDRVYEIYCQFLEKVAQKF